MQICMMARAVRIALCPAQTLSIPAGVREEGIIAGVPALIILEEVAGVRH
jgi:hypothetical protein